MKKIFWIVLIVLIGVIIFKTIPKITKIKKEKMSYDYLIIDKKNITSEAKFYPVKVDNQIYEVIAVKATDGSIRTAFNACQVCSGSGLGHYVQEGEFLVCQNCGNRFHVDNIENQKGGCNPSPITKEDKEETDTTITISKNTFLKNAYLFKEQK